MIHLVLLKIAAMFLVIVGGWLAPLLCGLVILVAYFVGLLVAPMFSNKTQRNTFIFFVAIPN